MDKACLTQLEEVQASGFLGEGKKVEEFREEICKIVGNDKVVLTNSCTIALEISLRILTRHVKDRKPVVACSPFTMVADYCVLKNGGYEIVWVDVSPRTLCPLPLSLAQTSADVLLVTMVGGLPAPTTLLEVCKQKGIKVLLDGAQGLYTYSNQVGHVSAYVDAFCTSFQAIKHLSCGDGGAMVFRNQDDYELAEELKWFGISRKKTKPETRQTSYKVSNPGYKANMNELAAAVGLGNLEFSRKSVASSRLNSDLLVHQLRPKLTRQQYESFSGPSEFLPSCWCTGGIFERRNELVAFLKERGIDSTTLWMRQDKHTGEKPITGMGIKTIEDKILFVPNGWWVNEEEMAYIAKTICEFYNA